MMRSHFTKLRDNPAYQKALIVVYIEANMSFITADEIATEFQKPIFEPIIFERRDDKKKGRVGIWTGPSTKEQMHSQMKEALTSNSLFYARSFISSDEKKQKEQFEKEVGNFRLEKEASLVPWRIVKIFYTGKSSGKDDLCITVQMALYWSKLRRDDPAFIDYCRARGLNN